MTVLYNIAKMTVSSAPGTGNIPLNTNVTGWLTFSNAGTTNGVLVAYNAVDGSTQEDGTATYSTTGPSLTGRTLRNSTTGSLLSLSSSAIITLTASKEDILNKTGDAMTGPLLTVASTSVAAGFNLPAGAAPTTPNNGDLWTTTGGVYAQVNGSTQGPFAFGSSSGLVKISTLTANNTASSLAWTGLSTYNRYILIIANLIPATTGASFLFQYGEGGTPTWQTTPTSYTGSNFQAQNASGAMSTANGAAGYCHYLDLQNGVYGTTGAGLSGTIHIHNLLDATNTAAQFNTMAQVGTPPNSAANFYAFYSNLIFTANTNAKTAIRIITSAGNLFSGSATLYGMS